MRDGERKKAKKGFAAMSAEKQREIARKGGSSVPKEKRAFSISRTLAIEAGRKGGMTPPSEKHTFASDLEFASKANRISDKPKKARR